jgi:hypothetical protein
MRSSALAVFLLLAPPLVPWARADVVTLPCALDNTLYESATGALSNGIGPTMFAGRTAQATNSRRRAVLFFNVAQSVPASATIVAVTLTLSMSQAATPGAQSIELHRVLASWGEGTSDAGPSGGSGAPATTGDATWKHRFFNTTSWSVLGGDFAAAASASQSVAVEGPYVWGSTPGMVADVQAWLSTPAVNQGWLLLGNEAVVSSVKRFETREAVDPLARPVLTITYDRSTPATATTWGAIRSLYR